MIIAIVNLNLFWLNVGVGILNYKQKNYKYACVNFFASGLCLAASLSVLLKNL